MSWWICSFELPARVGYCEAAQNRIMFLNAPEIYPLQIHGWICSKLQHDAGRRMIAWEFEHSISGRHVMVSVDPNLNGGAVTLVVYPHMEWRNTDIKFAMAFFFFPSGVRC